MAGALTMGVGRVLEQAAVFARNLIMANLLGASNQGVAAAFAILLSLLEMLSDFGAGRLIVQAADGEDPELQASLHAWEIARGIALGAVLFAAAGPAAGFFHVGSAEWAFRMLAVVPVLKGFEHLDLRRFQRHMRFGRFASASLAPQVLTAVAAWPLAKWLGDYSAALYLVVLQVAATVAASHVLAGRPYRVSVRAEHMRRVARFGLPLVLNGMVLLAVLQGDRAIVGRCYSVADLGVYSVAAGMAMMAGNLLAGVVSPLALPALSSVRNDPGKFRRVLEKLMELSLACAVPLALGFAILGPVLLRLLLSADYQEAGAFIGALGLAAGLRMLRMTPNAAQMAMGDNMALCHAGVWRISGTLLALGVAWHGGPLAWIAWCGVAGEIVALAVTAVLLRRRRATGALALMRSCCLVLAFHMMGLAALRLTPSPAIPTWAGLASGVGWCLVLSGCFLMVRPALRGDLANGLACLRSRAVP
jgi:O-antigen/teichoic acid export membrane protein